VRICIIWRTAYLTFMTRIRILSLLTCVLFVLYARAQTSLDKAQLKNLRGSMVSFSSLTQKDTLILVCFWSTSSDESVSELNAINANYEKWKRAVPFHMMAVSADEGMDANKVRPYVNMNGWKFDVFTDVNGDLRTALNSKAIPQTIILKDGKVLFLQSGFSSGGEHFLLEKLKALAAGKS